MMRRDYILRLIQELGEALARIRALRKDQRWTETEAALGEQFQRLVHSGAPEILRLSDTELLAKLAEGEATQTVRHKTLLLTTLLKEAGDVAAVQGRTDESRACYLKGLHLLLDVLAAREVIDCPEFVPKVEWFVEALRDDPLPLGTQARLMRHYEESGQFGRAEDALFAILDAQPDNAEALAFGILFFERLRRQSDAALADGNLPRAELESGLAELRRRQG